MVLCGHGMPVLRRFRDVPLVAGSYLVQPDDISGDGETVDGRVTGAGSAPRRTVGGQQPGDIVFRPGPAQAIGSYMDGIGTGAFFDIQLQGRALDFDARRQGGEIEADQQIGLTAAAHFHLGLVAVVRRRLQGIDPGVSGA